MSKEIKTITGDIYIGKGAGKMILDDMMKARRSIRVMSPYLSAGLVDILLDRFALGIHIELVTSDDIEDHRNEKKNSYRMVRQQKRVNKDLKNKKQFFHWTGIVWMFLFGFIALTNLPDLFEDAAESSDYIRFAVFAGITFLGHGIWKYAGKINFWQISYHPLFPFKIFYSVYSRRPDRSKAFNLHSKLYIIDDRIAYLGSVNFTRSGCLLNHETRIRITDLEAIRQLKDEFSELLWSEEYNHRSVDEWGRELYEMGEGE